MSRAALTFPFGFDTSFWSRLHLRVVNTLSLEEFATAVVNGTIGDHFRVPDVRRVASEFRCALMERGDWEEMQEVIVPGRKSSMINSMKMAVQMHLTRGGAGSSPASPSILPASVVHAGGPPGLLSRAPSTIPVRTLQTAPAPVPAASWLHAAASQTSLEQRNTLMALNHWSPPFFKILSVVRSVALRFGSTPVKFEVPPHFIDGVQSRRLRVLVLPFQPASATDGVTPSPWPSVRDLFLYINDQKIQSSWKRAWPERPGGVAKTLLALDITQYLSLTGAAQQRAQIDIFLKDYFSNASIVVAEPFTVEQIMERILVRRLRMSSRAKVVAALQARDAVSVVENQRCMEELYQRVLQEEEGDDIVAGDPTVTTYCPLTRSPIEIPVRGQHCSHVQCVDMTNYLLNGQRAGYWNCVVCDAEMREEDIQIDTVLWEYLVNHKERCQDGARLQISRRHTGSASSNVSLFYWHVAQGCVSEMEVVLDDDSEAEVNPLYHEPMSGKKRGREESTWSVTAKVNLHPEGTIENPIEIDDLDE